MPHFVIKEDTSTNFIQPIMSWGDKCLKGMAQIVDTSADVSWATASIMPPVGDPLHFVLEQDFTDALLLEPGANLLVINPLF